MANQRSARPPCGGRRSSRATAPHFAIREVGRMRRARRLWPYCDGRRFSDPWQRRIALIPAWVMAGSAVAKAAADPNLGTTPGRPGRRSASTSRRSGRSSWVFAPLAAASHRGSHGGSPAVALSRGRNPPFAERRPGPAGGTTTGVRRRSPQRDVAANSQIVPSGTGRSARAQVRTSCAYQADPSGHRCP